MNEALSMVREGAMSVEEAMSFTGMGRSSLYEAMARGELPYIKIGAGRRIPRRALELWLAKHLMIGDERVLNDA